MKKLIALFCLCVLALTSCGAASGRDADTAQSAPKPDSGAAETAYAFPDPVNQAAANEYGLRTVYDIDTFTAAFNAVAGKTLIVSTDDWQAYPDGFTDGTGAAYTKYVWRADPAAYLSSAVEITLGTDGYIITAVTSRSDEAMTQDQNNEFRTYTAALMKILCGIDGDSAAELFEQLNDEAYSFYAGADSVVHTQGAFNVSGIYDNGRQLTVFTPAK